MKTNYSPLSQEYLQLSRRNRLSPIRSGLLLILFGILLASCASEKPSDPVSIVQAAYDRPNNGDFDGFIELLSDDVVVMDRSGRWEGAEVVRADLKQTFDPQIIRFEPNNISSDGNVVTYTLKVFKYDQLVWTYDVYIDIIADGKIIFEGPQYLFLQECERDPSQAFCPRN
jgi:ketosteroid isomerase-like protein